MYGEGAQASTQGECNTMRGNSIPSLVERVRNDARHTQAVSREEGVRGDRLCRLLYLLEKNPEVADILDLMEKLK
jgi:hypothetical protein